MITDLNSVGSIESAFSDRELKVSSKQRLRPSRNCKFCGKRDE
jgi:hypothetical protein